MGDSKTFEQDDAKKKSLDLEKMINEAKKEPKASNDDPFVKMTIDELVRKLKETVTTDKVFWKVCHSLSTIEHLEHNVAKIKEGKVPFNGVCAMMQYSSHDDVFTTLFENVVIEGYHGKNLNYQYFRRFDNLKFAGNGPLKNRCDVCTDKTPGCVYRINAYIKYICITNNLDIKEVYKRLQEEMYVEIKPYDCPENIPNIRKDDYEFLDFFSVLAATVMIKQGWIEYSEANGTATYSFVDVIAHERTSNIDNIYNFYRSGNSVISIPVSHLRDYAQEKRVGINTKYLLHPDHVAAYILHLAKILSCDPVQLGLYIGKLFNEGRIKTFDYFKIEEGRQRLRRIPMNKEDAALAEKMFNYVINRFFNSQIPYLPLNMVLYSDDEKETKELLEIFRWITFFYSYFSNVDYKTYVEEISLADYSLEGVIKIIERLEFHSKIPEDSNLIDAGVILHVKDFHLLPEIENKPGEALVKITRLQNALERQRHKLAFVISGEKSKLKSVLEGYTEFYNTVVDKHLTLGDMTDNQIVYEIMNKLELTFKFEEGFEHALKEYVYIAYKKSQLKSKSFIDKVVKDIVFIHYDEDIDDKLLKVSDIPKIEGTKSEKDIWRDINNLEGLDIVKEEMRKLQTLLSFRRKTMGKGINIAERPNLHMVFEGNPGTGKTTVARILGDLLYNFGYLRENKIIEVSPKDLVAQWVGQTAPKTAAVCQSAYGGILFIDEAYELTVDGSGGAQEGFRSEAVTELVKQMEDNRDKLVIIFAGYTNEMQKMLDSNAGLASRIGTILEFQDYSEDELLEMYKKLVRGAGMAMTEDAQKKVYRKIKEAKECEDFGNGRFVRNLYEKTITQHAYNTIDDDDDKILSTITEADIPDMVESSKAASKYHIGFI